MSCSRIIPFVAADAVVSKPDELVPHKIKYPSSNQYPTIHEKPIITHTTERPLFYKVSHPNRFSPPTETEGKNNNNSNKKLLCSE